MASDISAAGESVAQCQWRGLTSCRPAPPAGHPARDGGPATVRYLDAQPGRHGRRSRGRRVVDRCRRARVATWSRRAVDAGRVEEV